MSLKNTLMALACALLLIACENESRHVFISSELNTSGVRQSVSYNNELIPARLTYEAFEGSGNKDTTGIDSLTRVYIDSIVYDQNSRFSKLVRLYADGVEETREFRKYYFNSDNLLVRMTRFSDGTEYTTDSVVYDYTRRLASFRDLINKMVYELEYDTRNNITSCIQKKIGDGTVLLSEYYYYDEASNPFLANLAEDELLFGCFNFNNIGVMWNAGVRPLFSSRNNVQACKRVRPDDELNELYEYQYREGMPVVQYGGNGVIYYSYLKPSPQGE